MKDTKSGPKTISDSRAERLRAALRENLKRRKAQAKAKAMIPAGDTDRQISQEPVDDGPEAPDTPNSAGFAAENGKG